MQCSNNLKQIGIAVHNFHGAYDGLPPFFTDAARAGTFAFLYPFGEQQPLWDMMLNATDGTDDTGLNVNVYRDWWQTTLTQEQRDAILMACVNRRFTILDANEELLRYCEDSLFTEELENDNG